LAVSDVEAAMAWLERVLGAVPIAGTERLTEPRAGRDVGNMAGTDTRLSWVGGYPVILLSGGLVSGFLQRHGPGVQSWAWEVDDNWEVEHIVRDRGIAVTSVNIGGRFFFMHPRDTHGLLLEWCDGKMPRGSIPTRPRESVVETTGLAWTAGVVTDADATAEWMAGLMELEVVDGNPKGPEDLERTIDLAVGDITIRLITPVSPRSRYASALAAGPRVHSFALRVADIDAALAALQAEGVSTVYREGLLAATDPASTLGLRLEWTE
jgi:catechol 2,3-dioxygenase-like lactoylglutathione lyase family enzyme